MSNPLISEIYEEIIRRLDHLIGSSHDFPDRPLLFFLLDDCLMKLKFWAQDIQL